MAVCAVQATSALDVESEAQVQAALDRAMRASGRSVLVIAHRRAPQTLKPKTSKHTERRGWGVRALIQHCLSIGRPGSPGSNT